MQATKSLARDYDGSTNELRIAFLPSSSVAIRAARCHQHPSMRGWLDLTPIRGTYRTLWLTTIQNTRSSVEMTKNSRADDVHLRIS
jgi:hypothetical protein